MIVHCPACGTPVEVPVQVKAVEVSRMGTRVEVLFQERAVEHVCPDETT